jgi:hypothetical protein
VSRRHAVGDVGPEVAWELGPQGGGIGLMSAQAPNDQCAGLRS